MKALLIKLLKWFVTEATIIVVTFLIAIILNTCVIKYTINGHEYHITLLEVIMFFLIVGLYLKVEGRLVEHEEKV